MKLRQYNKQTYGFMTYPLTFTSLKDSRLISKALIKNYKGEIHVLLKFGSRLPLLKEYWTDNSAEFNDIRANLFDDFVKEWATGEKDWQIVVTPSLKYKRGGRFGPGMPIKTNSPTKTKDIEAFMRYSDWVVDINATEAALYDVVMLDGKLL